MEDILPVHSDLLRVSWDREGSPRVGMILLISLSGKKVKDDKTFF